MGGGCCTSCCESHTSVDRCVLCGDGSQQIMGGYQDLQAADAICSSVWTIDGHGHHVPASSWCASRRTGCPTLFVECQHETDHALGATVQMYHLCQRRLCRRMCPGIRRTRSGAAYPQ